MFHIPLNSNQNFTKAGNGSGLERLISSHVKVGEIGRRIAEEVMDIQRRSEDSSTNSSPCLRPPSSLTTEVKKSLDPIDIDMFIFLTIINTLRTLLRHLAHISFSITVPVHQILKMMNVVN